MLNPGNTVPTGRLWATNIATTCTARSSNSDLSELLTVPGNQSQLPIDILGERA
jgi:hypothetical protein